MARGDGDGKTAVAVAGIVATALVGLAAAGLGWATSRDDRSNQRELAHAARVYDRKADAYLAALAVIETQRFQLYRELASSIVKRGAVFLSPASALVMANGRDASQRARVVAFGSPSAISIYKMIEKTMERLPVLELNVPTGKVGRAATQRTIDRAIASVEKLQAKFEAVVHKELS